MEKEKILKLVKRSENCFYRYLLTKDKDYIDRFFKTTERLKRIIERWKQS